MMTARRSRFRILSWSALLLTAAMLFPVSARTGDATSRAAPEPASARAMPVLPVDGETVADNPPTLFWPPTQRGHVDVTLRTADGRLSRFRTRENWLTLREPLPPGRYAWQVREADLSEAPPLVTWQQFEVGPASVAFPVPEREAIFAHAVALPHPRGFVRDTEKQRLLKALQGERRAGWTTFLARVDTQLGKSLPAEPPIRGDGTTPFGQRWPQMQQIMHATSSEETRTLEAAFAWQMTGRPEYLEDARRRALNLAHWDPSGATGFRSHDMAARSVLWTLALSFDWLYEGLSAADRTALLEALRPRMAELVPSVGHLPQYPFDSHGAATLAKLAAVSLLTAGHTREEKDRLERTLPFYVAWLTPWGRSDGGHANGTSYAQWDVSSNLLTWNVIRLASGIDLAARSWSRNFPRYLAYFLPPGTPAGVFGDGVESRNAMEWATYQKAFALYMPTPLARWQSRQVFGADDSSLLILAAPVPEPAESTLPPSTPNSLLVPSIGWAAMHSRLGERSRTSVYFKSSPYGSFNHSHADQNSIVLNARGRPLLIDSGHYDYYGSPHWHDWYKQTRAHNAITFDGGRGQVHDAMSARGSIVDFYTSETVDYAVGDATLAYGGELELARRAVVLVRPDTVLVFDALVSAQPRRWEWNLHAVHPFDRLSETSVRARNQETSLCIDLRSSAPVAFRQSDAFTVDPAGSQPQQWHGSFRNESATKDISFAAVLRVDCLPSDVQFTKTDALHGWSARVGNIQVEFDGRRIAIVRKGLE